MSGTLYLCGTPIGNLEDVTYRLLRVLAEVDKIAAEDTRTTRKLLARYDIHTPLVSYHAYSGEGREAELVSQLAAGANIALVSEAGMPGISDPGTPLVQAALAAGVPVTPVPGPSAGIAALAVSGLSTARFVFEGFLPTRKAERVARLAALANETRTIIFYEAPHRLLATLTSLEAALGNRRVAAARELTKKYEEIFRGTVVEARTHFGVGQVRGEFTLVVEGRTDTTVDAAAAPPAEQTLAEAGREARHLAAEAGLPLREAARRIGVSSGLSRNAIYQAALEESAVEPGTRLS